MTIITDRAQKKIEKLVNATIHEQEGNPKGTMRQTLDCVNTLDNDGNPHGGSVTGTGLRVVWQQGPIGRHDLACTQLACVPGCKHTEPNGAQIEDLLHAAEQRLAFFQKSRFACQENQLALDNIKEALLWLRERTYKRERRGVEGTLQP